MNRELLICVHNLVGVTGPSLDEFSNAPIERVQPQDSLFRCYDKARVRIWLYRETFQFFDSVFSIVRTTEDLSNLHNRGASPVQPERMDQRIPKNIVENLCGFVI